MRLSDLAEALTLSALLKNSNLVDIERPPADVPPLQPCATHSCPHPFDDEIPFEFCYSADDDDDGPSQRTAGIKILAEANELDVEMVVRAVKGIGSSRIPTQAVRTMLLQSVRITSVLLVARRSWGKISAGTRSDTLTARSLTMLERL
jgi:hypothetical protein